MAEVTIVRLADQASGFLTNQSASLTFLTNAVASETFLTNSSASATFLTNSSASTEYATKSSPTFTGTVEMTYPLINSDTDRSHTKLGTRALDRIKEGTSINNTAIGFEAMRDQPGSSTSNNTAVGYRALQSATGSNNIGIGALAGAFTGTGSNNVYIGGNTGNGAYQLNASNNIVISDGEGNIRIRSNGSGQIQMPNQTAFSVYALGLTTQSGNLTYNATVTNNGGSMNLATGLFTAPLAGHYFFSYYGFIDTGLSGNTTVRFQKNGSESPSRAYNDFNDASYGPVITISSIIYLAANDNVRVNLTGAGMHGNENSFFSGFLIG